MGEMQRSNEEWLMTAKEVQKRTGLSRTTIYRYIRNGTFPEPRKLSAGAIRWNSSVIESYIRGTYASGA